MILKKSVCTNLNPIKVYTLEALLTNIIIIIKKFFNKYKFSSFSSSVYPQVIMFKCESKIMYK